MSRRETEVAVEAHLHKRVKILGGLCIKLSPIGNKGLPDRLLVLPGGRMVFVELKKPTGVLAVLQGWWARRLNHLGAPYAALKSKQEVDTFVDSL